MKLNAACRGDPDHRRVVAACLVKGAYVLQRDKGKNRLGEQTLAPPWWESFGFQLFDTLKDCIIVKSTFGAIFKFKFPPPSSNGVDQDQLPPTYAVAFRGTMTTPQTICKDWRLDLKLIFEGIEGRSRVQCAIKAIESTVGIAQAAATIWVAGHSLGSTVGQLAGRKIFKANPKARINYYLFNPPFPSLFFTYLAFVRINSEVKYVLSFVRNCIIDLIDRLQNDDCQREELDKSFAELSQWVPNLFLNLSDPICVGYAGYFNQRKKMGRRAWLRKIKQRAARISSQALLKRAMRFKNCKAEHLLPSAHVTVAKGSSGEFRQAHKLQEWWQPNIEYQCERHVFNEMI
ncbi:hypothetical protein NMG60_11035018 [Bertholletia excelsa]